MSETQAKENAQKIVSLTINDLIYTQVQDLGKRMDRLEKRMDKLEERLDTTRQELNQRMDRLEARMDKQDEKIDRLADKIDALHNEIKSSTGHISIANISTVAIAVGVLYSIFSK